MACWKKLFIYVASYDFSSLRLDYAFALVSLPSTRGQGLMDGWFCWQLRRLDPIWFFPPWDWDCVWVPPHENTSRPHFGVGTNHDLILDFLAKRPLKYYRLDDLFFDF